MNVEIGTEAAQFPEKEYINGIFVAVCLRQKKEMLCRESAVVLVTHQLQYLEQADLIVVLKQGEIQVQILLILFFIFILYLRFTIKHVA
jgi:hypothetical protein